MRDGDAADGESGGAISKTQCRVVVSKMGRRGGVTQRCAGNSVTRHKRMLPLRLSINDHAILCTNCLFKAHCEEAKIHLR